MKKSEILQLARELIKNGKCRYICHALGQATIRRSLRDWKKANHLTCWISNDLLQNSGTYEGWLTHTYPGRFNNFTTFQQSTPALVRARLAWIDWMIEHWKARGQ